MHDIDHQPDNEVLFKVLASLDPQRAASGYQPALEETSTPAAEPVGDVIMYCTPWCPACRRARAYFQENGIKVVEVDISRDRASAQRVRGWTNGYETTPTFNIKGTIIVDFDKTKVAKALGLE